jgi:ABC-type Fe2+-enterobactin transport system substrate-binding protein
LWLDLKRGETVFLLVANNNNLGAGAASFLLEELSAIEVDQAPDRATAGH